MNREQAAKLADTLGALGEIYGTKLSEASLAIYATALSDLDWHAVLDALGRLVRTSERFPTPASIRNEIVGPEPSQGHCSVLAWQTAWQAVDRVGAYRSPVFEDGRISQVIRLMGGWPAFCRPEQDTHWHERQFRELYESLPPTDASDTLMGLHEHGNELGGFLRPPERRVVASIGSRGHGGFRQLGDGFDPDTL